VQAHLDDFNLAQEFGTYGRIKGLSGGQKVKLVLAAAFWTVPHILVSDFFFLMYASILLLCHAFVLSFLKVRFHEYHFEVKTSECIR
jgi:ABC-type dipeptide/oligopeptide/nickel transport system ATPase subunit